MFGSQFFLCNLHLSNQTGVWCLIWQPNLHLTSFSTSIPLLWNYILFVLCCNVIIAPCTHWELTTRRPWLNGLSDCRSRFWQRGGGWTHGAQLWNYLHNCKVKAVLRGGQQRALCLGSAFWPRRNTICCHGPPILPLGPITTVGQGGQSAAPVPRPTAPLTIVAVGFFHLHEEDQNEQKQAALKKKKNVSMHKPWTYDCSMHLSRGWYSAGFLSFFFSVRKIKTLLLNIMWWKCVLEFAHEKEIQKILDKIRLTHSVGPFIRCMFTI